MTLPTISAYALPTQAQLPNGRVTWKVDPSRAMLLVHDMQEHFVRAYAGATEPLASTVANIARLAGWARESGVPVVYSAQPEAQTPDQRGLLTDFWGVGIRDAAGAQILPELTPHDGDVVLTKWRYSAFQRTRLAEMLADSGRDQLVIVGIYAHIGVQATASEAFMRDIQPFVVADAVADFSRTHHEEALTFMAQRCARLLITDDLVSPVSAGGAG